MNDDITNLTDNHNILLKIQFTISSMYSFIYSCIQSLEAYLLELFLACSTFFIPLVALGPYVSLHCIFSLPLLRVRCSLMLESCPLFKRLSPPRYHASFPFYVYLVWIFANDQKHETCYLPATLLALLCLILRLPRLPHIPNLSIVMSRRRNGPKSDDTNISLAWRGKG